MPFPFSFEKPIRRLPYAAWVLGIFLSQHALALAISQVYPWLVSVRMDWEFALMPLHAFGVRILASASIGRETGAATPLVIATLLYHLLVMWSLVALSFRRAADADLPGWIAVLAIPPAVQIAVLLGLSLAPTRAGAPTRPAMKAESVAKWTAGAQGFLAGVALTVAAIALSTLVFGGYGYGAFVISPFLVGATTAAIANARNDMGIGYTSRLVTSTVTLGGLALVALAIEGIICLIMAAPLGLAMAWLGGLLGRAIALHRRNSAGQTLSSFAVLPIVLVGEFLLAPMVSFETYNTISIDAPPARVWEAIVNMERIDAPPPAGFRLGMAYPLGASMIGEGVGATRLGVFSTGTALERVTEWEPGRKLAFAVLQDVPAMRELSPYAHVHAPHNIGYFSTKETSFELIPRESGGTRLIERTSHILKLEPVLYWLPLARLMVDQNNARVLAHIRRQAERVR